MEPYHDLRMSPFESRDVRDPRCAPHRRVSPEVRCRQRRRIRAHRHPDARRARAPIRIRHHYLHRVCSRLVESHRGRKRSRPRPVPRGQGPLEPMPVIQPHVRDLRHQHAGLAPVDREIAPVNRHFGCHVRHREAHAGNAVDGAVAELRRCTHRHEIRATLPVMMLERSGPSRILPQFHRAIAEVRHVTDRSGATPRHQPGHVHRPRASLRERACRRSRHPDLLHLTPAIDRVEDVQELLRVEHRIVPGDVLSKATHQRMHTCVRRVQARRGTESPRQARDRHRAVAGHVPQFHLLVHPELVRRVHRQRSIRRMDQQRRAVRHLFRIEGRHPRHAHHDVRLRRPRHQSPTDPQLPDRVRRRPESHDVMHLDIVGIQPVIADGLGLTEGVRVATCRMFPARQALDRASG